MSRLALYAPLTLICALALLVPGAGGDETAPRSFSTGSGESWNETLERAGLDAGAIDIVLCTGGSSLIPAVRGILEDHFSGRVVEHDPFTSVAAGLAIASYTDW